MKISNVGELHGGLQPRTRATMLKKIKNNEFNYIVATDVAARGIDIEGLSDVISIDLPKDLAYYVHRSGRTGRKDFNGSSYVLYNVKNQDKINILKDKGVEFEIVKLVGNELVPVASPKKKKPAFVSDQEKQILNKYAHKKVKPGYKKKRKQELDKVKQERRRQHIKENIAKIKKEKYKRRRKEIFEK
jgi:ATP-dependent RNA helicase CshB